MIPTALIVTLQMDAAAAAYFTAMRKAHFPSHRNWLAAHITLFHALPLTAMDEVLHDAAGLASDTKAFAMQVDRLLFLGAGVAYALASADGTNVRRALAARWQALLGRQDKAKPGPLHVTVQNKVEPRIARALHTRLAQDFTPYAIRAVGLQVWHYVGGPWQHVATFAFADPSGPQARQEVNQSIG